MSRHRKETNTVISRSLQVTCFIAVGSMLGYASSPITKLVRVQDTELSKKLDAELQPSIVSMMDELRIPGLAAVVVSDGEVVFLKGFGVQSTENSQPVTTKSLFHMASVSKPFTATAVMSLVESGKISLDDPITKALPYFAVKDTLSNLITVAQLLSHTSGLPDETDFGWESPLFDDTALEHYVRELQNLSLISIPGAEHSYSNIGYSVLGDVISKISGNSFEEYVKSNILRPIGMQTSTFSLLEIEDSPELTSPHSFNDQYHIQTSTIRPYSRPHAPSSTLYSCAEDMAKWLLMNLSKDDLANATVLSSEIHEKMWTPISDEQNSIALGWFLDDYRGNKTVQHSGGDLGYAANMVFVPEQQLAVAIMTNFDRVPVQILTNIALDIVLGLETQAIGDLSHLHLDQILYQTIEDKGVESVGDKFDEIASNHSFDFNQVRQLLSLGRKYTQSNRNAAAAVIYAQNLKIYPDNPNLVFLHERLAKALIANKDIEAAIEVLKRAHKLNPDRKQVTDLLAELEKN